MLAGKVLHVAEGGSDKYLHSPCHVAVQKAELLLQKTSPNHDTSSSTFHFFMHLGFSFYPVWCRKKCCPSDPNKLNLLSSLKWTLDKFSSLHTTCSSAKVSLAFDSLCWREAWSLQSGLLVQILMPRQILKLFSTELASNSSCSAEPIAHWVFQHYPVFSCICLMWTTSHFGGLEWISVTVNLQYSWNYRFGMTNFSCNV